MSKLLAALNHLIRALGTGFPTILLGVVAVVSFFRWGIDKLKAAAAWIDDKMDFVDFPDFEYIALTFNDELKVANTLLPLTEGWSLLISAIAFTIAMLMVRTLKKTIFFWRA